MNFYKTILQIFLLIGLQYQASATNYKALKAASEPVIDGIAEDVCWASAVWAPIDQAWVGHSVAPEYCSARYKASWAGNKIFVLMEVTDDILVNWHPSEPLNNYPGSDCPEIFIDEDHSGGNHETSFNAFAYHISIFYNIVDIDIDRKAKLFNEHIKVMRTNAGNVYTWEMAITVYNDQFVYGAENNPTVSLYTGKTLGFSAAYNDSDKTMDQRDLMLGSSYISNYDCLSAGFGQSNLNCSYQSANVFGTLELAEEQATANHEKTTGQSLWVNINEHTISVQTASSVINYIKIFTIHGNTITEYRNQKNNFEFPNLLNKNTLYIMEVSYGNSTVRKKIFSGF